MMKKVFALMLTAAMAVSLVACGAKQEAPAEEPAKEEAVEEAVEELEEEVGEAIEEAVEEAVVETTSDSSDLATEIAAAIPEGDYSQFTVGFCGMTLNNEYHIIVANAVKKSCEAIGMGVEVQAGAEHASVEEQLVIIENYIAEGVDGIILVPASSQGLISALMDCEAAGIPVINLDTQLDEATRGALESEIPFYGTDNYVGGSMVGELFAEKYPDGAKVAILRGVSGQTNDDDRYNGFLSTAGDGVEIVAEQHCDWETDKAYTCITNVLNANPDLEVIYCENDLMGIGSYQAVEEAGKTDQISIYSYDGISEGIQYVVDGKFVATCAQQPIVMGKLGVINMCKVLMGEKAESYIDTGCKIIDANNCVESLEEVKKYTEAINQ
ncbi:MAG: sugar ABC transporter substrate-binding protein [Lachnospiraceae bacterium]|nr:sugar ABC transporter substrate-binding protein [Lachnospiraceae bacterium]